MLFIREAQMAVFRKQAIERFENRLVGHFRVTYPQDYQALGEAGIRERIRAGITAGVRYDIRTEGAVTVLIELMFDYGNEFEKSPAQAWAHSILAHSDLPDYLKVDLVRKRFSNPPATDADLP